MDTEFTVKQSFSVSPEELYSTWLSSEGHSKMTGAKAECSNEEGETFTAWDGYITGTNISLTPNKQIVQAWRTAEFNDKDEDSTITIDIASTKNGCEITLTHKNIPENQPDYKQGWVESYFTPMEEYFSAK